MCRVLNFSISQLWIFLFISLFILVAGTHTRSHIAPPHAIQVHFQFLSLRHDYYNLCVSSEENRATVNQHLLRNMKWWREKCFRAISFNVLSEYFFGLIWAVVVVCLGESESFFHFSSVWDVALKHKLFGVEGKVLWRQRCDYKNWVWWHSDDGERRESVKLYNSTIPLISWTLCFVWS